MSTSRNVLVHRGFGEFIRGKFEDGGSNLYVNANGLRIFPGSPGGPRPERYIDLNRNGYLDFLMVCHRNDLGHQVDSLIYWNGPNGVSSKRTTPLPGMGPHWLTVRDPGNAYTREPIESYFSPALNIENQTPVRIHWEAKVPETTHLKFQLRWASSEDELEEACWRGPEGENTYYENSGEEIQGVPPTARWLQYWALFVSLYGCRSPQLREVRLDLKAM